jgi:anti-sigma factor RsiW
VALEDCSTFSIHDLAALADGNLSEEGLRRLANHIPQCRICRATLAALIEESQNNPGATASERPGGHDVTAWVDAAASGRNLMAKIADNDDTDD